VCRLIKRAIRKATKKHGHHCHCHHKSRHRHHHHIHMDPPVVNLPPIEPAPVNIEVPVPSVTVVPGADIPAELRNELASYVGQTIEIIPVAGGANVETANRIGVLESVGDATIAIRPTIGNAPDNSQVVYYLLSQIIGFRPLVPVGAPVAIS
jgi:hypothetical protein